MIRYILNPFAVLISWVIRILNTAIAILGCIHFFFTTGANISYVLKRKRWFEGSMLGRSMKLTDMLEFGLWHANLKRK